MNKKITTRTEMMAILSQKYPNLFIKTSEEFKDTLKDGIWTSGERGIVAKDNFKLFDYYAYPTTRYVNGTHKELRSLLKKHGWCVEWYDAGTVMIWQNC